MRYMGVDYGKKRVGIALSDEGLQFALPKVILPADYKLISNIKHLCDQNGVTLIVIGESKNYKGEENDIMKEIRSFAEEIKGVTRLPVVFEPEFMTSAEAERVVTRRPDRHGEGGIRSRKPEAKNEMLDASAAALILKSYLERNK